MLLNFKSLLAQIWATHDLTLRGFKTILYTFWCFMAFTIRPFSSFRYFLTIILFSTQTDLLIALSDCCVWNYTCSPLRMTSFPDWNKIVFEAQPFAPASMNSSLLPQPLKYLCSLNLFSIHNSFQILCCPVPLIRCSCVLYLFLIFPTRLCTSWRPELSFNLHAP